MYGYLLLQKVPYRQLIPLQAKTKNNALGYWRNIDMTAEGLSLMDVADVHLNNRRLDAGNSVGDGNTGVGEGTGVKDDTVVVETYIVELVQDVSFVVALVILQGQVIVSEFPLEVDHEIVEGVFAVNLRLAPAKEVKVGSVDDDDTKHRLIVL